MQFFCFGKFSSGKTQQRKSGKKLSFLRLSFFQRSCFTINVEHSPIGLSKKLIQTEKITCLQLLSDISHVTDTCKSQTSDPRTLVCVVFVVWVEAALTKPFRSPFELPMVISYLLWTPVQVPAGPCGRRGALRVAVWLELFAAWRGVVVCDERTICVKNF